MSNRPFLNFFLTEQNQYVNQSRELESTFRMQLFGWFPELDTDTICYINSKFSFLSIDARISKIGWKFIWRKRVEKPKVLKKVVNFRPTVPRSWLLGLTSQEDGAEIIYDYTLRLAAVINTVLKFPHSKFSFQWTDISSFVAEFLQWSVSHDVGGSQRSFVNKGPGGQLDSAEISRLHSVAWSEWLVILKYRTTPQWKHTRR